ncbi:NUDIX hydrolase [Proteus terrae]|uniref:NUDIX hydrolase n=1 Tax=Proteus terrae TaxID=1574161 RepID=UPI00288C302E|nr:NUDIX domain-containing protein [Proteus terrae]
MIEPLVPYNILNSLDKYDRIVVGGIIKVDDISDKVLFLKRSQHEFMPNVWEIPSGGIEEGESILQALKREIKEETNLDILYIEKFVSAVDYLANEAKCLQINFNVRCSGKVKLSDEHSEFIFSRLDTFLSNLDEFMLKIITLK